MGCGLSKKEVRQVEEITGMSRKEVQDSFKVKHRLRKTSDKSIQKPRLLEIAAEGFFLVFFLYRFLITSVLSFRAYVISL